MNAQLARRSPLAEIAAWVVGSALAGAVVGIAVGIFSEGGIETPLVLLSTLFGIVVGDTSMVCAVFLFPRIQPLPPFLRWFLLGLALLTTSALGSLTVLALFPLFVVRDPKMTIAIVSINALLALIVGSIALGYERMRQQLQITVEEMERAKLIQAQLREEAALAELSALQARINPHFFFNTLNTIASLLEEDPEKAEEVIETLSRLFRYTFKAASKGPVPFQEELEFVRDYLTIEQARFGERLAIDWAIDEAALGVRVPGLILQPLVENAVGHGVSLSNAGGTVRILAQVNESQFTMEVSDDGAGLTGEPRDLIRDGHGLGNVRKRLAAFYRGKAALTLSPGAAGKGTTTQITVPLAPVSA